jgi:hypothetical protein
MMNLAVPAEIDDLRQMKAGALRAKYREVFGEESRSSNRQFLFRRIACPHEPDLEPADTRASDPGIHSLPADAIGG